MATSRGAGGAVNLCAISTFAAEIAALYSPSRVIPQNFGAID
jgi:hypothetical protein